MEYAIRLAMGVLFSKGALIRWYMPALAVVLPLVAYHFLIR